MRTLKVEKRAWPMHEPFAISRGVQTETDTVIVTLTDEAGHRGRGEGCGVAYAGETVHGMMAQIEVVRAPVEAGADRTDLLALLPPGGARCALDAALWDLEAKQSGTTAFALAGVETPTAKETAFTIGIRDVAGYEVAAAARARHALLKIKVGQDDPLAAVRSARRGAPDSAFIVDPNQSWSVETLMAMAPSLADLGVVLLEQPIRVGDEAGLDGWTSPVPLCADELINGVGDLDRAAGRFSTINIKLDKTGGLTEGLALAQAARSRGFDLMVGCMAGSSLSMAPAMVLAQQCVFVDLDGPLLQSEDWSDGLSYKDGVVQIPEASFWG